MKNIDAVAAGITGGLILVGMGVFGLILKFPHLLFVFFGMFLLGIMTHLLYSIVLSELTEHRERQANKELHENLKRVLKHGGVR